MTGAWTSAAPPETEAECLTSAVFATDFGHLAVYGPGGAAAAMTLGFTDAAEARAWVRREDGGPESAADWRATGAAVTAYLAGEVFSLDDVRRVEPAGLSEFARAVRRVVEAIPYGQTRTYGQVAELAGRPRAARAVGTVMSTNRLTLVMPCHRVVPAGGKPGRYNSPGGVDVKVRLLALEASASHGG